MPRDDLFYEAWSIPDATPTPGPWNQTLGFGQPPGTFSWIENGAILKYTHDDEIMPFVHFWQASDGPSPRIVERLAKNQMEAYCRERNMLDNEYRKLSPTVLEMCVGNRTTIISASLASPYLFEHRWVLVPDCDSFRVATMSDVKMMYLDEFLLRLQPREAVSHADGNPFNNTRENLLLQNTTVEGNRIRASPWPREPFNDEYAYWMALPPKRATPPMPHDIEAELRGERQPRYFPPAYSPTPKAAYDAAILREEPHPMTLPQIDSMERIEGMFDLSSD
jgi:hypothetical protein